MRLLLSLVSLLLCCLAGAQLPTYRFPGLGINLNNERADSRQAVFEFSRIDALRENVERFGIPWLREQLLAQKALGNRPLVILYQNGSRSKSDFAAWCGQVGAACQGLGAVWEIWNEQNSEQFWGSAPDAAAYVDLTAKVKAAMPAGELLIAGGLSTVGSPWDPVGGLDIPYLIAMTKAGIGRFVSAIAIHPYMKLVKDAALGVGLQVVMARQLTGMEVWCTEAGIKPHEAPAAGYKDAGDYLLEAYLAAVKAGAKCFIVYRWTTGAPTDPDREFGMVQWPSMAPRPAFQRILDAAEILGRFKAGL